jgi:hypothetical protein
MELFLDCIRSPLVSRSLSPPFANHLPQLIRLPILGHLALAILLVLFGCPSILLTSFTISVSLVGFLVSVLPENRESPPRVTHESSVPCRLYTPWYDA